ncbi:hypothetical protein NSK_000373 [Nannochloropsis salina CCMP1776]|uniref:RNA helicase n=1 Tax=Nannochloropsis salina CCMP1776 TaxID=1027361 RepID=A0A4D9DGT4_9STRA|nr:hypothetical protein NSK_000373 [Nannochloropsis salina CCMP1776]|eukprot:TFJ88019.1 hypothetical protein NSK_000373 [Nannochloropsis salina CCMP1776]
MGTPSQGEDLTANTGTFGENIPFAALGLSPWLTAALSGAGKATSTHIQALALPTILAGENVVIGSETGAGKTLAYLLPVMELAHRAHAARTAMKEKAMAYYQERRAALKEGAGGRERVGEYSSLAEDYPWEAPFAIVLVPNGQLSEQVLRMAGEVLGQGEGEGNVRVEALKGSVDVWPYRVGSRAAPDVLVCTPATLSSFDREVNLFGEVNILVVDEADMLLEGDYGRHLERILVAFKRADKVHTTRSEPLTQYVLAAATLPSYGLKSVEELVKKRFPSAVRVHTDLMHKHHPQLTQVFVEAPEDLEGKIAMLLQVLEKLRTKGEEARRAEGGKEGGKEGEGEAQATILPKTMVFLNTATAAARTQIAVQAAGFPSVAFHKEVRREEREANLQRFRSNQVPLLVCTDLAARGLDIPDVRQVVQVEFAPNVVQHLHRIGRAVRAGREGRAVNFYDLGAHDLVESLQLAQADTLERSFSRQRGFRKKIKKYGRDYYRLPGGAYRGPGWEEEAKGRGRKGEGGGEEGRGGKEAVER